MIDGEWVGTPVLDQTGRKIGVIVGWEVKCATTITWIEFDDDVSLDHLSISVGYTLAPDEDGDGGDDDPPHVTPEILAAYDAAGPGPENLDAYTAWHETVRQVLKMQHEHRVAIIDAAASEELADANRLLESLMAAVHDVAGPSRCPRHYPMDDRVSSAIKALATMPRDGGGF